MRALEFREMIWIGSDEAPFTVSKKSSARVLIQPYYFWIRVCRLVPLPFNVNLAGSRDRGDGEIGAAVARL